MLKVGSIECNGDEYSIRREFYSQGMIFKDEEAYRFHKDQPCYVPELSDNVYTGNDFLKLCNYQEEFADELFDAVDWQHPESEMTDWIANCEWVKCENCGRIISPYNDSECPNCGRKVEVE